MTKPETILFSDSARGVYIPQHFAENIKRDAVRGVNLDAWNALEQGPDGHEYYWEYWDEVLNDATVIDDQGREYTLHQDGDLWLIPVGMTWNDETESFEWEEA